MEQNILLSLSHISKRFKTELALRDISMALHQGEILGFLGPSGAGKTTTIKIITGQLRQTSGEAKLLGTDSANIDSSIYERIGVVSDNSGIYGKMTVWQNLAVFARIWKVPRERVEQVLAQVGLAEHKSKPAGKLSKGQTQRLVLARAVLHKPRILFLDEPTSGLDPSTAVAIHRMLLELKEEGMAIFLIAAVAQIKWLCISRNTMIMLGTVIVIAMVYACKILYGINTEGNFVPFLTGFLLNLGITMNICTEGFIMVGTSIAEEKENHTLRVLMTSSVTGMQYFIGSILIPFVILMAVNYIVLFISGIPLEVVPWLSFFLVSMVASLTSCVLGMIVGICARNQMNANLIAYPFLLVFLMVPVFGSMSEGLRRISGFLFTGVMTGMTECLAGGERYVMSPLDIAVLFGELLISVLVFLTLYKRNGYEKD